MSRRGSFIDPAPAIHLDFRRASVVPTKVDDIKRPDRRKTVKDRIKGTFPIVRWLPNYTIALFFQDLLAGFSVGLTEIPQGIAYAIVAGLPSQYGLYSAIMGGIVYVVFGGCKDVNMGPTAIMALFVQESVTAMGPAAAILVTFLSGFLIFVAGVLHMGFLVEFFSFPVTAGFTTAAAVSIASSQLKQLFGLTGSSGAFLPAWQTLFRNIGHTRKCDAILGFANIVVLFGFREIRRFGSLQNRPDWSPMRNAIGKSIFLLSLAGNALAVMAGTTIAYIAETRYNSTPFILTGDVAGGLPNFTLPSFSTTWNGTYYSFPDMLSRYGTLIAFCPMVAFLEHIAIVKAFNQGQVIDATQELIALGLSNMAGSLVQSMPVTGSFTRTAINNASGVRTQVGGLVTSCMLLICLALLTEAFRFIPKATLAAIIMVSMYYLCQFQAIRVMWKTKKLDLIPFFATLISCLLIGLEYGIIIGIATNLIFILYESARPKLYIERFALHNHAFYVVRPKVSLYFTSSEYFRDEILTACWEEDSTVIVDGEFVSNIDGTIAKSFANLLADVKHRNQTLIFWNFSKTVADICTGDQQGLREYFRDGPLDPILEEYALKGRLKSIQSDGVA